MSSNADWTLEQNALSFQDVWRDNVGMAEKGRQVVARLAAPVQRSPALVGVGVLVLTLVVLCVFVLPPLLVDAQGLTASERLKAENDVRSTLLQALAGVVLLGGLYFTARTYQLNRQSSARTYELDREGQITERFTRAIDQLGDEKLDVRLGGIYALERIARSSSHDHGPIMEVLTAFLREHSPRRPGESGDPALDQAGKTSADVQAVATVLGRRVLEHDTRSGLKLNLRNVDLRGVELRGASLPSADLAGANLQGAFLRGANLQGANLEQADLRGKADLAAANLAGTILTDAKLDEANLRQAILAGAKLDRASLRRAFLDGANLQARLIDADLERAILRGAHLQGADLSGANLAGAVLGGANLADATLGGANLMGAMLGGANLDNVHDLTRAQLEGAVEVDPEVLQVLGDAEGMS
jgi:uncharacterized protein YjbI with pentapeptide repeats